MNQETKEKLIRAAMKEAAKSIEEGNSPFGAVLSDSNGDIVEVAHNTAKTDFNPTAHAEMNLIGNVCKRLKTKDLSGYYLVSNAQSCPMCFSAAVKAGIKDFVYGCAEDETLIPSIDVFKMKKYCKDQINIETGILEEECDAQIKSARMSQR